MRVLLIDNYDSFTHNVVHLARETGVAEVDVRRNTALDLDALGDYAAVIASPGPGLPSESGQLLPAVRACLARDKPYLGICLGHQALAEAVGGRLRRLDRVRHGVEIPCYARGADPLLMGLSRVSDWRDGGFTVGSYHSWVVDEAELPPELEVLADSPEDSSGDRSAADRQPTVIQAMRVRGARAYGLQFHPESIMTAAAGPLLLRNFFRLAQVSPAHA